MSDITKCHGDFCPLKEECYRYTSPDSKYVQSYFMESPYDNEKQNCEHYYTNNNGTQKSNTKESLPQA